MSAWSEINSIRKGKGGSPIAWSVSSLLPNPQPSIGHREMDGFRPLLNPDEQGINYFQISLEAVLWLVAGRLKRASVLNAEPVLQGNPHIRKNPGII